MREVLVEYRLVSNRFFRESMQLNTESILSIFLSLRVKPNILTVWEIQENQRVAAAPNILPCHRNQALVLAFHPR